MAQPANAKAKTPDHVAQRPVPPMPSRPRSDEDPPLILSLRDLVRDEEGEVVLFNDSGLRALSLSTSAAILEEGVAGRHTTAAGEDVTGFRFVAFSDGLRLYYQQGLEVIVVDEPSTAE